MHGTGMERRRLDANRLILNELTITNVYEYDAHSFEDASRCSPRVDCPLIR
jgi:hypothetical protein